MNTKFWFTGLLWTLLLVAVTDAEQLVRRDWYVDVKDTALSSRAIQELNKTIPYLNFVIVPTVLPVGYTEVATKVYMDRGMGGTTDTNYELSYRKNDNSKFVIKARYGGGWGGPGVETSYKVDTLVLGNVIVGKPRGGPSSGLESDFVFFAGAGKSQKRGILGLRVEFSSGVTKEEAQILLKGLRVIK